jgi:hypothetical protein
MSRVKEQCKIQDTYETRIDRLFGEYTEHNAPPQYERRVSGYLDQIRDIVLETLNTRGTHTETEEYPLETIIPQIGRFP